ncbi:MAG: hypothetical protein COX77_01555 [Candidatus Komeilibacteria bacterium CG_4_10_14_0_2_um_filter_37_10]|uniref:Uncharacterized protein n=1 Tax=Candidatus Komeilibacteria bacterium CG_4_10_14_0_2_um_filter_37_10 TaxID=1974470 RepID=A0A2M7VFN8_9BACT|nr:MAG: hypothetical protein COX77_01555 [Candidatus Komeilibacteria bacterium CG_4_10_14_0_2_um_filter_37_10]PJA92529.1 MAG: hypothetical protein CO133_02725 [Candidatus Komeilibacteria bacterium CG_4_9_14_3_um_filter_37_5]
MFNENKESISYPGDKLNAIYFFFYCLFFSVILFYAMIWLITITINLTTSLNYHLRESYFVSSLSWLLVIIIGTMVVGVMGCCLWAFGDLFKLKLLKYYLNKFVPFKLVYAFARSIMP